MRRLILILAGTFLLVCAVPVAVADTVQSFTARVSPSKPDRGAKLTLTQRTADTSGVRPLYVQRAVWSLPSRSTIDVRAAGFCSARKLQSTGKCPSRSQIGTGEAKLAIFSGPHTEVDAQVAAFNAKRTSSGGGKVGRLLLLVDSPAVGLKATLIGRIAKTAGGPYRYQIRFDNMALPEVEGVVPTMTMLRVELKASRKKRTESGRRTFHYFRSPSTCSGRWFFLGEFRMQNKLLLRAADDVTCSSRSRRQS